MEFDIGNRGEYTGYWLLSSYDDNHIKQQFMLLFQ